MKCLKRRYPRLTTLLPWVGTCDTCRSEFSEEPRNVDTSGDNFSDAALWRQPIWEAGRGEGHNTGSTVLVPCLFCDGEVRLFERASVREDPRNES